MRRATHRLRPGAGAVVLAGVMIGAAAHAEPFELAMEGSDGATYAGICTVTSPPAPQETIQLSGTVPSVETLSADGLVCEFATSGRVEVTLRRRGLVVRSAASGGKLFIAVRR